MTWNTDDDERESESPFKIKRDIGFARVTADNVTFDNLLAGVKSGSDSGPVLKSSQLTALLFARPDSSFVTQEILPTLPYFHFDSGEEFHFYCVGYGLSKPEERAEVKIGEENWTFSVREFIRQKDLFEAHSNWKYSGGADIVLCNDVWEAALAGSRLDLQTAVCMSLDKLVKQEKILSFETFFQSVLRFAGKTSSQFSNGVIPELTADVIRNGIIQSLPEAFREPVKKAEAFAVRDIRRR